MNTKHTVVINGQTFDLSHAVSLAHTGPVVSVKADQIALVHEKVSDIDLSFAQHTPVFYEFEGKYQVLAGCDHVCEALDKDYENAVVKGRLISRPNLKRTRLSTPAEFHQPQITQKLAPADPADRPVFSRDRTQQRRNQSPNKPYQPRTGYHPQPRGSYAASRG